MAEVFRGYTFDQGSYDAQQFGGWLESGCVRFTYRRALREHGLPHENVSMLSDEEVQQRLQNLLEKKAMNSK